MKGLRMKLVVFVTVLAIVTYTSSAICMSWLRPHYFPDVSFGVFQSITFSLGVIWSAILAALFSRVLTKPLIDLSEAAERVANHEIGTRIPVPKGEDEIVQVARSFERVVINLRSMIERITKVSEATINTSRYLTEGTNESLRQADEVERMVEEIAKGAEATAHAIQEASEQLEQVRTSANSVNEEARETASEVQSVLRSLNETGEVVEHLVQSISYIGKSSEASQQVTHRLDEQMHRIVDIVDLVGTIAEQTNLLALNASIEAARAGEHGAGFAVVAEEVRKLADESQRSVTSIVQLVNEVQGTVNEIVQRMSEQSNLATVETKRAQEAEKAMQQMSYNVREMAERVMSITSIVDEQTEHIESSTAEIQTVVAIAEQTAANTAHVTDSTRYQQENANAIRDVAERLEAESKELDALIHQFKMDER